jgi:lipopolysaccharide export system protein LptA
MKLFCLILLIMGGGLAVRAQTNAPIDLTDIHSDTGQFYPMKHQAVYSSHVRVDNPQLKLTGEWLVADLPYEGHPDRRILVTTNVVIDLEGEKDQKWHVTCEQALYDYQQQISGTNETITLTGNARAKSEQVTVTGEPLIYNLATKMFSGSNYETIFNSSAINLLGTNIARAKTNQMSAPK